MNNFSQHALYSTFIVLAVLGCYYGLLFSPLVKKIVSTPPESIGSPSWILYERISGAVLLGLLPATLLFVVNPVAFSQLTAMAFSIENFYLIPITCTSILVINFFATRKPHNRKGYPLLRVKSWNRSTLLFNQATWAVYLFAYEFLLRGVLLSAVVVLFGWSVSILLNVLLYALLHLHRSAKQIAWSVPFGFLMCWLTFATSSWISAALIHTSFAASYEFFVIAYREKWWGRKNTASSATSSFLQNTTQPSYETD